MGTRNLQGLLGSRLRRRWIAPIEGPSQGLFVSTALQRPPPPIVFTVQGWQFRTCGATSVSGVTLTGPDDATGSAGNSAPSSTRSPILEMCRNFTSLLNSIPLDCASSSQKSLPLNLTAGDSDNRCRDSDPTGTPDQDVEVRARISSDSYGQANSGAWTSLAVSFIIRRRTAAMVCRHHRARATTPIRSTRHQHHVHP